MTTRNSATKQHIVRYSILLVCDFGKGLTNRILDVFRFFQQPPHVILVRRGTAVSVDPRLSVSTQFIPIPYHENREDLNGLMAAISIYLSAIGYLLFSVVLYLKLQHSRENIRLVHAQYVFPQGLFGLLLVRLLKVPVIITAQGSDVNIDMMNNSLFRALYLIVLRRADMVIVVSKPMQHLLLQLGISSVYLPNSVDTISIRPHPESGNKNAILFIAAMIERKQPLLLLHAFERITEQVPTATLVMCGKGPLENSLRKEVETKRLQEKVMLLSYVDGPAMNALLSNGGIFVLPSLSEGTSLALLEAMAAGLPVIVTRNQSHTSILEHGINGLLFEMGNVEELAEEILLVISDVRLRSRLSKSARYLCETQFSNTTIGNKLEKLYLGVVARSGCISGIDH